MVDVDSEENVFPMVPSGCANKHFALTEGQLEERVKIRERIIDRSTNPGTGTNFD